MPGSGEVWIYKLCLAISYSVKWSVSEDPLPHSKLDMVKSLNNYINPKCLWNGRKYYYVIQGFWLEVGFCKKETWSFRQIFKKYLRTLKFNTYANRFWFISITVQVHFIGHVQWNLFFWLKICKICLFILTFPCRFLRLDNEFVRNKYTSYFANYIGFQQKRILYVLGRISLYIYVRKCRMKRKTHSESMPS